MTTNEIVLAIHYVSGDINQFQAQGMLCDDPRIKVEWEKKEKSYRTLLGMLIQALPKHCTIFEEMDNGLDSRSQ